MLDVPHEWVRVLDLSTFTGDAEALEASIAVPADGVPRFIATGGPVRWAVVAMDGGIGSGKQAADTDTSFGTRLVKLSRSGSLGQTPLVTLLGATAVGKNANREFVEDDVSKGDVFAIAVTDVTADAGSAAYLWVYPTAGAQLAAEGSTP